MELDLDTIRPENVKQMLDTHIWKCMKEERPRLWVITGNNPEMKLIVKTTAKEYGLSAVDSMFNESEVIIDFI